MVKFFITRKPDGAGGVSTEVGGGVDVQLQEGQVGVAIVCLRLALLHDIVLEDLRRLGVVAVEAIEDLLDVFGPLRREVEGGTHGGCDDGGTSKASLNSVVVRGRGRSRLAIPFSAAN